jgi:hypothetical protein
MAFYLVEVLPCDEFWYIWGFCRFVVQLKNQAIAFFFWLPVFSTIPP